jgi:hypothetical protein
MDIEQDNLQYVVASYTKDNTNVCQLCMMHKGQELDTILYKAHEWGVSPLSIELFTIKERVLLGLLTYPESDIGKPCTLPKGQSTIPKA